MHSNFNDAWDNMMPHGPEHQRETAESDEETDDPIHADRRNFYKVEQWSRDGQRVVDLVFAGTSLDYTAVRQSEAKFPFIEHAHAY
jgi:hypothetical protein